MSNINPPIAVLRSSRIDSEHYKRNLEDILNQLWTALDGSTDTVTNISIQEQFAWNLASDSEPTSPINNSFDLSSQIFQEYSAVSKSIDYTAVAFDFVNAKSGSLITLPQYPAANDVVILRNGDGSKIKFSGNGKNINGNSAGAIVRRGTTLTIQYFIDEDEWYAR